MARIPAVPPFNWEEARYLINVLQSFHGPSQEMRFAFLLIIRYGLLSSLCSQS